MTSRRTWDRRILAGLIRDLDTKGLTIVQGLEVDAQGAPVEFFYDQLSASDAERLSNQFQSIRDSLERRLGVSTEGDGPAEALDSTEEPVDDLDRPDVSEEEDVPGEDFEELEVDVIATEVDDVPVDETTDGAVAEQEEEEERDEDDLVGDDGTFTEDTPLIHQG